MIYPYLLGLIFALSILAFSYPRVKERLLFYPYHIQQHQQHWRWISHVFVHGNWPHLLINLWVLFTFVSQVERIFYKHFTRPVFAFVLFLVLSAIASSVVDFLKHKHNKDYASLGASGVVSSVLFVFIVFSPTSPLQFIFLPGVNIPAFAIGAMYLLYEYRMRAKNDGIAHDAHFFGAIFGILAPLLIDITVYQRFVHAIGLWFQQLFS